MTDDRIRAKLLARRSTIRKIVAARADPAPKDPLAGKYPTLWRLNARLPKPKYRNLRLSPTWPCGHPRTEENAAQSGGEYGRCRICKLRYAREYQQVMKGRGGPPGVKEAHDHVRRADRVLRPDRGSAMG